MITSSRRFSTFSELNENIENNNTEKPRRDIDSLSTDSIDSDKFKPTAGCTSKISSVELIRQALRKKQYDVVKLHLGMSIIYQYWKKIDSI